MLGGLDPARWMPPAEDVERIASPALLVHLDVARRNVRRVIELLGGDPARWRPHTKTTKLPEVWRILAQEGLRHFKCATTREAELLCATLDEEGVEGDVLLAHPLRGPGLRQLAELARRHPRQRLSVLCEDEGLLESLELRASALRVFVDVNVGMDRTGIPVADAGAIVALCRRVGERLAGVHAYEGHVHDLEPLARERRTREVLARVAELLRELERASVPVRELVTSGTPTFRFALEGSALRELPALAHRVSPGTVVFHDARSEELDPGLGLAPAAVVLSRVVSHPAPQVVTCDAGSKSLSAEAGDPVCVVLGEPQLLARTPSEEHLPLRVISGAPPPRGSVLLLAPRHVCPTVNLASTALLLEDGRLLGEVPVRARGHATLL